jgi:hypothetical protein
LRAKGAEVPILVTGLRIKTIIAQSSPLPSALTMLRDLIER